MKKHILLPFVLALGFLFFANDAKSQNFQIVASFGTAHNWAVPNAVLYEIDYYYPYHQIVHINRERRGRNLFFNVLLERRGQFVELYFGRHAMILDINYYHSYPLAQHICSGHCGYHGNFYRAHRVVAHNNSHRNNHIVYRSGRNYNTYAARNSAANRNVGTNYAYSSSRSDVIRSSNARNSGNRTSVSRSSNPRINKGTIRGNSNSRVNEGISRGNTNSRVESAARKPSSSVRSNSSRENSEARNSRSRSSSNARSRN